MTIELRLFDVCDVIAVISVFVEIIMALELYRRGNKCSAEHKRMMAPFITIALIMGIAAGTAVTSIIGAELLR